jgi:hypothetical protein
MITARVRTGGADASGWVVDSAMLIAPLLLLASLGIVAGAALKYPVPRVST